MRNQFEPGAHITLKWEDGKTFDAIVVEPLGDETLTVRGPSGELFDLELIVAGEHTGKWFDVESPDMVAHVTITPQYYAIRLETGWFCLEAQTLEACVRDIPNHNPDGEVTEVRRIDKYLFDEYETHGYVSSPETVRRLMIRRERS